MKQVNPPWSCHAATCASGGGSRVTAAQKLRDWDAPLAASQESLCLPDCNWQNHGNPATQSLNIYRDAG